MCLIFTAAFHVQVEAVFEGNKTALPNATEEEKPDTDDSTLKSKLSVA